MLKGSVVALVTPWTKEDQIDEAGLRQLLDWHLESGTHGVVIGGTTGESTALSSAELIRLIEIALEQVAGKMPVIVGNGGAATNKTLQLTRELNRLPIDGFLCVAPYYVKPEQQGLVEHFTQVANTAEHGVYLYNVPGRTLCDLTNESVLKLAEHPNIVGIKDATGDLQRAAELIKHKPGQFALLSGDDASALEFMSLGGDGVISVTANVVPEMMALTCQQAMNGELEAAAETNRRIDQLHQLLFVEANPIPVKWLLARMGKVNNSLRLPLTPLLKGQEQLWQAFEDIREEIQKRGSE